MPDLVPAPYRLGWSPTATAAGLDRAVELRADDDALAAAWADPGTQVLVVRAGRVAMDERGLLRLPSAQAPHGLRLLLGRDRHGRHVFAVDPHGDGPRDGGDAQARLASSHSGTLREVAGRLRSDDLTQAMHAVALTEWHERHPRCPRCGGPTEPTLAGYARRCLPEGREHHPRTDPAVIVLVLDRAEPGADRALLARQASWPAGRFSTLAGFVEPGETAEEALAREVAEEVGVQVDTVAYAGSQPWPFPASLMLAYYAVAAPGSGTDAAVRPDGVEIVDARWFDRAGLAAQLAAGEVLVPPALSVARRLVEGWYGGRLRGREAWR
jgi:NAD+ diphosphatase